MVANGMKLPRNILTMVDIHDHTDRRKLWEVSMNTNAVQGYALFISQRVASLCHILENSAVKSETVDLSAMLSCFS